MIIKSKSKKLSNVENFVENGNLKMMKRISNK